MGGWEESVGFIITGSVKEINNFGGYDKSYSKSIITMDTMPNKILTNKILTNENLYIIYA